ncbi:MAG: hypothetical protein ABI233_00565 [Chthoniobacterales bacterium]
MTEVSAVVFNPGASSLRITTNSLSASGLNFVISGAGITNDFWLPQRFLVRSGYMASRLFRNAATIGSGTSLTV